MNKYLIILLIFLACSISNAQTSEGKFYLGASISYLNPTSENADAMGNLNGSKSSSNNLTTAGQMGYFITNNFVLGLTVSYVNNKSIQENIPVTKNTSNSKTFAYGIFGRAYTKITEKLYFTNSISFSIRNGTNVSTDINYTTLVSNNSSLDVSGFNISYAPGFSYFFNPHIALNATVGSLSYDHYRTTITSGAYTGTSSTNGLFTISLPNSAFNIGVNFLFGKTAAK